MLLKYSQTQKRAKLSASGKPQRVTGMKLASNVNMGPRVHRKMMKNITNRKLNNTHHRAVIGLKRELKSSVTPVDPCDNSNDSGLGFDHHSDYPIQHRNRPSTRFPTREKTCCSEDAPRFKKHRMDFKVESDEDANDYFSFYETVQQKSQSIHNFPRCVPSSRADGLQSPPLTAQLSAVSSDGRVSLDIVSEPEWQHRARYQTEGSRGAVKDRTGTSFPVVRLSGYNKPAMLQVFIGTDEGEVAPHMFYQACRVAGKNSTPSLETTIDRTIVIQMDIHPVNNMVTVCDCVGILKERNVDVEHRFPDGSPPTKNSRKKSTSVRMVFRTTIRLPDGSYETLQTTSDTIACTQPQGVPEVSLMSWTSSPATGGVDLFIIGKNFVKDTKVVFQEGESWKVSVQPNKDFLHQSHLVCKVPPYARTNITAPVRVRVSVESCGKSSEPQSFAYTPVLGYLPASPLDSAAASSSSSSSSTSSTSAAPEVALMEARSTGTSSNFQQNQREFHPVMFWSSMPFANALDPAAATLSHADLPKCVCHKECIQMQLMQSAALAAAPQPVAAESHSVVKKEEMPAAELPASKMSGAGIVAELSTTQQPSLATIRQFVSNQTSEHPLPSINVENYLSRLENPPSTPFLVPKQEQQPTAMEISAASAPIDLSNQLEAIKTEPSFGLMSSANTLGGKRRFSDDDTDGSSMKMPCLAFPNQTTTDAMMVASSTSNSLLMPQPLVDLVGTSLAPTEATERLDDLVNSAAEKHMSSSSSASSPIMSPIEKQQPSPLLSSPNNTSPLNLLPAPLEELNTAHSMMMAASQPASGMLVGLVQSPIEKPYSSTLLNLLPESKEPAGLNGQQLVSSPIEKSYPSTLLQNLLPPENKESAGLNSSPIGKPYPSTLLQNLLPPENKESAKPDGHLGGLIQDINRLPGGDCTSMVPSYSSVPVPVSSLLQGETLLPLTIPNAADNILPLTKVAQPVPLLPMVASPEQTVPVLPPILSTNQAESAVVKRPDVANPLNGGGIQELTQMSENDLLSYINPSCFDQVNY
ncbi:nuclear factor of activated T-cells 5 [Nilaparvata lugens]|uniref:nuclear factor of activated T-cells 5 n=1 Tax=Nilaparvata lugens TaxID=108931 RepID=UPI00193DACF7|nr:nuclear factor of activated T-cells 5 [Nilaparvata lugens]